jgi:type II secretory pathway pseudopilin PulG
MSLLEVLGATAIFLMSIVAIGELMSSSTDQALDVQFRSRATRLCQSKLNEFASGVEQLNGATEGDFDDADGWKWKADVSNDGSAANLYKVQITVSHDTPQGPIEVTMAQYVFDPTQRGQIVAQQPSSSSSSGSGSGSGGGSSGSGGSGGSGGGSMGGAGGGKGGGGSGSGGMGGGGKGGGGSGGGMGGGGGGSGGRGGKGGGKG